MVHDIVSFCKDNDILCQGRGSAANSAVCYAIGITNVDPVRNKLLFERFLSPERDGPPDIDVDIESDRREEAIQHVYQRTAASTPRRSRTSSPTAGKSSVRDMARALGFSQGQQDAWSKQVSRWGERRRGGRHRHPRAGARPGRCRSRAFRGTSASTPGGMVICDRPIADVCPVEWARMENRSVLQWDKDDCAAMGLVKFDMLGLGMLSALHYMIDLVAEHKGIEVDLAQLDLSEPAVYEMLQRADSVGVFQVESRAQMATLPRLKPRTVLRPGGGGGADPARADPGRVGAPVHPAAQQAREPVTYDHPSMEKALGTTLGVPLFQEQLMQMAVDVCGFHRRRGRPAAPGDGFQAVAREDGTVAGGGFYEGCADLHGIGDDVADRIYEKLYAFANFGFPESHSQSLRGAGVLLVVVQAAPSGGVLRRRCCGRSRWGSTRRSRWWPTPAGTGCRCTAPTSTPASAHATLENRGLEVRLGSRAVSATSATSSPSGSSTTRTADGPFTRSARPDRAGAN